MAEEKPTGFAAIRACLKARTDSEHEQAVLRIVIVTIVLAWMWLVHDPSRGETLQRETLLLMGLSAALAFALLLFAAICISPAENVKRRLIGSLADNGTATFVMFVTTQAGFAMIGVYLFVAFGNGFRYGRKYLFISQGLALAGFGSVLLLHEYWGEIQTAGWSLFVALVVLPLYVSTLLKRIHEAQRKAEEANVAKTAFLANMSHEMRTPLNGIVGVADLLKATPLSGHQSELIRLLAHSVLLLRSLVDDVLDISKIEAGGVSIDISDFDLHATVNGLVRLLRPHAEAKGIELRAMVDPAIDYTLRGDQHHLRQVLLNLMSNAVKFTERGEIHVGIALAGETVEGVRVRFEVQDTGIGITPEAQQRIFERFVQADGSTTRRFGGTGLGTTIAKQLVELMGGQIGVRSKLGEGSQFWFEIPLLRVAATEAAVGEAAATTGLVVTSAERTDEVTPHVLAAVGKVETVPTAEEAVTQLRALAGRGVNVPAVVVTGDLDAAAEMLERIAAERADAATALIYVAKDAPAARREPRLRRIEGLQVVPLDGTQRHFRNAIHAATTRDMGEGAEVIDLAAVLQQKRQPVRILVAEDNATNLAILRQLLESAGHTVVTATDGEEALDLYEREAPELAILDFNMPERNGVEVVAAIRTMERTGTHLPVLILSAAVTIEARERAKRAGADEFVSKPFEAAQLLQSIDRLARRFVRSGKTAVQGPREAKSSALDAAPILDPNRLAEVERIASSADFLQRLLAGFRDDVELLLKKLDAAVAAGQTTAVGDALHAIKGAALGIGASQLAARCAAMEEKAAGGQLTQVYAAAPDLRRCFDATMREVTRYSAQKHQISV